MRSVSKWFDGSRPPQAAARPIIPLRFPSLPRAALAAFIVLSAVALSTIVFSEPAPVDALLFGAVIALPLLAQTRPGLLATAVLALMLVTVAFAFVIAPASIYFADGVKHQLITVYLLLVGFVLAGYVAMDAERRAGHVMLAYVLACTFASALALIGFFAIVPGTSELFTLFGRARGTFKDPNVLAAAISPALVWLLWSVASAPFAKAKWSFLGLCIVGGAILLTFSRGAWLSVAASMLFMSLFIAASLQDRKQLSRFALRFLPATLLFPLVMLALLQIDAVREMAELRFRLEQSYDSGPFGRFGGQTKALDLTLQNPFGIGTFGFLRYHTENPHNVYLKMFLSSGWIGGLAYICAVGLTLAAGIIHALTPGPLQRLQIIATAAFFGLVVQGFIVDTDHWRHFFLVQALVIGLADARLRGRALQRAADAVVALRRPRPVEHHLADAARTRQPDMPAANVVPATVPAPQRRRPSPRPGIWPETLPERQIPAQEPRRAAGGSSHAAPATGRRLAMRVMTPSTPSGIAHKLRLIRPSRVETAARTSNAELATLLERTVRQTGDSSVPLRARMNERGPLEKAGLVNTTRLLMRRIERDFAA